MWNNKERYMTHRLIDTNGLTLRLYADSPFDLSSDEDNTYRDDVDRLMEQIDELQKRCAHCDAHMYAVIKGHAHTEDGEDVTGH